MTRAGAIALMLLGSIVATILLPGAPSAYADGPAAASVRWAPDTGPSRPLRSPSPSPVDEADQGEDRDESGVVESDPLAVSITRLTPSTLPRAGRVSISGRVTNLSEDEWTDLTVYAATSATPVTTQEELVAAEQGPAGVEPADYQRLVEPGLFVRVRDLGPGESTSYRLTVPRDRLGIPATPGVYRLGTQVLGTVDGARAEGADGRARVLIASVDPDQRATRLALAVQLRKRTVRTATGEIDHVTSWSRTLSRMGRLRQLVRLLGTAESYPVSVVLDPAVVEAVGTLAEGNPGVALQDTTVDGVEEVTGTITDDAPPEATAGEAAAPGGESGGELLPEEVTLATDAISWLQELRGALEGLDVLAVPYGDMDLAAAARNGDPDLIGHGLGAGISTLSAYGIQATGVLAPHHGLLGQVAADAAPRGVPALVAQRSFVAAVVGADGAQVLETPPPAVPSVLVGAGGAPVWTYRAIRTPGGAAAGTDALAMRQRVLARAAIQAITRPDEPLVVALPPQWPPGSAWREDAFFRGIRSAPWVRPVPLDDLEPDSTPVVADDAAPEPTDEPTTASTSDTEEAPSGTEQEATAAVALRYPDRQLARMVPRRVMRAAGRLAATGEVLGELVVDNDALGPRFDRQALLGVSFHTRGHVPGMTGRLRAAENVVTAWLRDVEVMAPRFVRMSSESGNFLVPVVNQLDVPVRVKLRPRVAGPGLRLDVPEPVVVGPGTRQPIRVAAQSASIGVRSVRVDLVTADGERLYPGPRFSIRSSQVARWVWVAMAVGSAVLFVAIVLRIIRQVRARKATHGPVLGRGAR